MTIVLSVLLVVCLVAIFYLFLAWARDAHTSDVIAAEMNRICDDVRDRLRLSKAECVGLSDQVAGLNEEAESIRSQHEAAKEHWHRQFVEEQAKHQATVESLKDEVAFIGKQRDGQRGVIRKLHNRLKAVRTAIVSDEFTTGVSGPTIVCPLPKEPHEPPPPDALDVPQLPDEVG